MVLLMRFNVVVVTYKFDCDLDLKEDLSRGQLIIRKQTSTGLLTVVVLLVHLLSVLSDPERRRIGAFGYIGLIIMLISTIILALKLLGIIAM